MNKEELTRYFAPQILEISVEEIVDFILADRERIVKPIVEYRKWEEACSDEDFRDKRAAKREYAIQETMKNAEIEE